MIIRRKRWWWGGISHTSLHHHLKTRRRRHLLGWLIVLDMKAVLMMMMISMPRLLMLKRKATNGKIKNWRSKLLKITIQKENRVCFSWTGGIFSMVRTHWLEVSYTRTLNLHHLKDLQNLREIQKPFSPNNKHATLQESRMSLRKVRPFQHKPKRLDLLRPYLGKQWGNLNSNQKT